jgi:ribosomal protein S18 acetylase RimI-like enzyme
MTADYEAALRNHRIDLLYLGGTLAALIETIPGADHLLIENVAVSPAFQGRGRGRRLVAHAEELAASEGRAEIRLYTNKRFAENRGSTRSSATASTARNRSAAGSSCT